MRLAAVDAAGVDLQIVSLAPPGTHGLPAADAVARHPSRLRAMTTLPMSDPDAAVAEPERTVALPAHVGIMSYGRSGDVPLDHPANDGVLATAARLGRPIFVHPQIPAPAVREANYSGFSPIVDLALSTFGWGWHVEAGTGRHG